MFWASIVAILIGVIGALIRRGLRAAVPTEDEPARTQQIYRDHLAEIECDLTREIISTDQAQQLRVEVSRRLLASAAQQETDDHGTVRGPLLPAVALCVISGLAAALLYLQLGAPGYGDLGLDRRIAAAAALRENRPAQADAELTAPSSAPPESVSKEFLQLMEKLRAAMADRPNDLQGQTLLAKNEAALGNYIAAHTAQEQVLRLKRDTVNAEDFAFYADLLIYAAGGYVSPRAETALLAALQHDQNLQKALYYMGLMYAQTGRPDLAFQFWEALIRQGVADPALAAIITEQINAVALQAGVSYASPTLANEISAAEAINPEDRNAMVASMVAVLAQRLAEEGGPATDWARLIDAYGVLQEKDKARLVFREAQQIFAGNHTALELLNASARRAEISQ